MFHAGVHEREMFAIINADSCKARAAIALVFEHTTDDAVVRKAMEGFVSLARIAVFFDMAEVFNQLVVMLSNYFFRFIREHLALASSDRAMQV